MGWRRVLEVTAVLVLATTLAPSAAEAASRGLDPAAGWNGRAVRDPHRSVVPPMPAAHALTRSAPIVLGTGYGRPGGSPRVRAVQRMLRGLGYRPGPVDGKFGPRTAAATAWFQHKHGLRRTGMVGRRTAALLASRASGAPDERVPAADRTVPASSAPAPASSAPAPAATTPNPRPAPRPAATPASTSGTDLTPVIVAVVLLAASLLLVLQLLRIPRSAAPTAEETVADAAPDMLGYVALPKAQCTGTLPAEVVEPIEQVCARRGWSLNKVVHDVEPSSGRLSDRPGLFHVLDQVASYRARGLIVRRLRDLTDSVTDLGPLMRWIDDAGAILVVLDVELDTSAEPGRRTARTLVEVSDWERRRLGERTRNGLALTKAQGRPSVRDDPALAGRIRKLREEGLSLQAIADTLNEEGVPTLRGGARWRPSSVQAAAGYKRPPARQVNGELPPIRKRSG
jgi:DNA invertase Pin-like site-specific DNA recombinase/peptidoglycan hydrolase-like protein with peptidoglycan-binding domain